MCDLKSVMTCDSDLVQIGVQRKKKLKMKNEERFDDLEVWKCKDEVPSLRGAYVTYSGERKVAATKQSFSCGAKPS
jgi:hypothetical protein